MLQLISRVYERSSKFKSDARAHAAFFQPFGMMLLADIHEQEKNQLEKIWDAPDAEEFAAKIQLKKDETAIAATLAEFDTQPKSARVTDEFFTREKRQQAKKELALGGELN